MPKRYVREESKDIKDDFPIPKRYICEESEESEDIKDDEKHYLRRVIKTPSKFNPSSSQLKISTSSAIESVARKRNKTRYRRILAKRRDKDNKNNSHIESVARQRNKTRYRRILTKRRDKDNKNKKPAKTVHGSEMKGEEKIEEIEGKIITTKYKPKVSYQEVDSSEKMDVTQEFAERVILGLMKEKEEKKILEPDILFLDGPKLKTLQALITVARMKKYKLDFRRIAIAEYDPAVYAAQRRLFTTLTTTGHDVKNNITHFGGDVWLYLAKNISTIRHMWLDFTCAVIAEPNLNLLHSSIASLIFITLCMRAPGGHEAQTKRVISYVTRPKFYLDMHWGYRRAGSSMSVLIFRRGQKKQEPLYRPQCIIRKDGSYYWIKFFGSNKMEKLSQNHPAVQILLEKARLKKEKKKKAKEVD